MTEWELLTGGPCGPGGPDGPRSPGAPCQASTERGEKEKGLKLPPLGIWMVLVYKVYFVAIYTASARRTNGPFIQEDLQMLIQTVLTDCLIYVDESLHSCCITV